jgi:SNF2 family DNA or RNA helicase
VISIIQNNDVYEVRFPFNYDILNMVRNVAGRQWHKDEKCWTIPKDRLGFLLNQLKGTNYESQVAVESDEDIDINAPFDDEQITIPDVDISNIPYYVKKGAKPFQHQLDTLKFNIDRKAHGKKSGFLLADEMGCAKTCSVINLAIYARKYEKAKHCLIICCLNGSKYNWEEEIESQTRGKYKGYILGSRKRRDGSINKVGSGATKLEDLELNKMYGKKGKKKLPYFIITNIETLRTKKNRKYVITQKIIDMINSGEISMIAIDEIHYHASPTSAQGKQLLQIKKKIKKPVEWIPMTGTPIVNKPTDLFLPLRLIDAHKMNSYYMWCQEFCVYGGFGDHQIIGYKNIPKLKQLLFNNMLRRLKMNILDLPPKIYHTEYVENTPYQEKLYKEIKGELIKQQELIVESMNPLAQFTKLRQVTGCPEVIDTNLKVDKSYLSKNAKVVKAIQLISDIVDSGEKVIVFSNWLEPLRTLYKFIATKYKVCVYTGTMAPDEREKHKAAFLHNPDCKILLGTVGALGASHNLSAATNVIFLDEPWTAATKFQAEDRAHRADSKYPVNIYTIITRDSLDERVHNIVYTKELTSNYIVDDKLDLKKHPELLDILLG